MDDPHGEPHGEPYGERHGEPRGEPRGEPPGDAQRLAARLSSDGIRLIALTGVDNAGITRAKTIPAARLPAAALRGIGMSSVFDVYTADDSMAATADLGGPVGDLRLFPDLERLTPLAAQPGWAWAPVDRYTQTGAEHPACQRLFARRAADRAAAAGFEVRMGFETEWVVTRADRAARADLAPYTDRAAHTDAASPVAPASLDYPTTGPAYGMTRVVELSDYLGDIAQSLAAQGIEVLQIHPEYTIGQFEVSTAPGDPVRAADDAVLVRETVRAVSVRHGLRASFSPVVVAGQVGNGRHLHMSLYRDGVSLHRDPSDEFGLAPEARAFLAGVLGALPALSAVGCPSPVSALRLLPSHWAGVFQCWGVENREAALRLVIGARDDPDGGNAELKRVDAAANPYLVVGTVLAAGLHGVASGGRLPPPVTTDPATLSPAERDRLRLRPLPVTLDAAADELARSEPLREALGGVLHDALISVRRYEAAQFADASPEDIAAAYRWRY